MKLTAPYFSHSSHCEVSNTRCLPVQHARIPLQVKYCLQHLTLRAKFTKSLNKSCRSPSFGSIKLMCLKGSGAADITWVGHILRAHFCVMLYLHESMYRFSSNITFGTPLGLLDPEVEALRHSETSVTTYCQHGDTYQRTWLSWTPLGEPLTSRSENLWEEYRTGQLYQRLSSHFHFGSNRTNLRDNNFLLVIQE